MDSGLGVFRKVTKFVGQMGLVGIALALTILQSQMFFTGALKVTQILTVPRLKPMLTVSATPSVCLKIALHLDLARITSSWWLIVARKP